MELPPDYYHCFLGNGLDAVLVGYTGAMTGERIGVDRCAWYKSDRYYPEDRLVRVAGRFPIEKPLEHATGSGWYELAPLGRVWYEVLDTQDQPAPVQACRQRFVPQQGLLESSVDYGLLHAHVTTFMHATASLLVIHIESDQEMRLRAWMAPGVWVEEGWDTDPFCSVAMDAGPGAGYDLGETRGRMALQTDPTPLGQGGEGRQRWLELSTRSATLYFSIYDQRQGAVPESGELPPLAMARQQGYERLLNSHLEFWNSYFSASGVTLPDEQLQRLYSASMYHFKAAQNPQTGGLPVNNLRRTWSSHVFWDSYYLQHALLEANHLPEALEGVRFFQRTLPAARRHAQDEFGCPGLKWDWEITHDGRKAYGVLLHMKDQVHNKASYANEIFQYYQYTRDLRYLAEFYPLLEGLSQFFLDNVIESDGGAYATRPVVGVHESPVRVRNDGITVAGSVVILQHTCQAAALLGLESDFTRRCAQAAEGLLKTLDSLYTGEYFVSYTGASGREKASIWPIYPMQALPYADPRSLSTAEACLQNALERPRSPWAAGVLATILAHQDRPQQAWQMLNLIRPMMCAFGGLTEIMENGQWNMQYFLTAQGAVCTALHSLLLQERQGRLHLFPALPEEWESASFERLLVPGARVSASFDRRLGRIEGSLTNITSQPLDYRLQAGMQAQQVRLAPGECHAFSEKI